MTVHAQLGTVVAVGSASGWSVIAVLAASACAAGDGDDPDARSATVVSTTVAAITATTTVATTTAPTATTSASVATQASGSASTSTTSTTSTTTTAATTTSVVTASALAAELEGAERGIRDESLDSAARAAHGRAQQDAYRRAGNDRDLLASVPQLVAADVRDPVAFNVAARLAVLDHAARRAAEGRKVPPPSTLPAWTIVAPRPVDELLGYYREAEQVTGVSWTYLAAINFVETRMGRIVGASDAGAIGPMQFLPSTWAECCTGDPADPRDAIIGAATYLAMNGAPGDMGRALHAYNPNDGYVGAVIAYAANLAADPRAYVGYHAWEVYVSTSLGPVHLPVGYSATEPIDAATYVKEHAADR